MKQPESEMAKSDINPEQLPKEENVNQDTVQIADTEDDFDIKP